MFISILFVNNSWFDCHVQFKETIAEVEAVTIIIIIIIVIVTNIADNCREEAALHKSVIHI